MTDSVFIKTFFNLRSDIFFDKRESEWLIGIMIYSVVL
jgi:hypothetical protein